MTGAADPFAELIDECHDLVQQVAPDGKILRVNRAWLKTLVYAEDEVRTLDVFDVLHPDCQGYCRERFDRVVHGEAVQELEASLLTEDGHTVVVLGSCRGLFKDDRPTSCFAIISVGR